MNLVSLRTEHATNDSMKHEYKYPVTFTYIIARNITKKQASRQSTHFRDNVCIRKNKLKYDVIRLSLI